MTRHFMLAEIFIKIVSMPFRSQLWALIMSEMRQDIRRMTLTWASLTLTEAVKRETVLAIRLVLSNGRSFQVASEEESNGSAGMSRPCAPLLFPPSEKRQSSPLYKGIQLPMYSYHVIDRFVKSRV